MVDECIGALSSSYRSRDDLLSTKLVLNGGKLVVVFTQNVNIEIADQQESLGTGGW